MKTHRSSRLFAPHLARAAFLAGAFGTVPATLAQSAANQITPKTETVIELSPFEVSSSRDTGYRALSTLAGTRLNTNLADVAGAISVVTEEMLRDVAAVDAGTILQYTVNAEVGGYMGNFSDGPNEQQGPRISPHEQQRVRGLASASLTRNFFLTSIPFDSYNTGRLSISRGPNALLFGIGRAGGIVDNSLASASRQKDSREVTLQFGQWGHNRASANLNQVLIKDRLGVRIAGLRSDRQYPQRPAYEKSDRLYLALEGLLRKGGDGILGETIFRANYEGGKIVSERPQTTMNASALVDWFQGPDPAAYAPFGITVPAQLRPGAFVPKYTFDNRVGTPSGAPALIGRPQGFATEMAVFYDGNGFVRMFPGSNNVVGFRGQAPANAAAGRPTYDFLSTVEYTPGAPFPIRGGRAMPYSVFDNREKLLIAGGLTGYQNFAAWNVTLQQDLFKRNGGLEYSYDRQRYFTTSEQNGVNSLLGWLTVDVNQYLVDGAPNPNLGRPFVRSHFITLKDPDGGDTNRNEAHRLTGFYDLDLRRQSGFLRWLGKQRFTGVYSDQLFTAVSKQYVARWDGPAAAQIWTSATGAPLPIGNGARNVHTNIYVGPSLLGPSVNSLNDVRLTSTKVNPVRKGDSFTFRFWNPVTNRMEDQPLTAAAALRGASVSREEIKSKVLAWQSYLLSDHLVGLIGWREDADKRYGSAGSGLLADGTIDPAQALTLSSRPSINVKDTTLTKSIVGHLPDRWNPLSKYVRASAHWGVSENFSPGGLRTNVRGEQITPESGRTKEAGISLRTPSDRLGVRFNWFETVLSNQSSLGFSGSNNFYTLISGQLQNFVNMESQGLAFDRFYRYAFQATPGAPKYTSWQQLYGATAALISGPTQALYNMRVVNGTVLTDSINEQNISDTQDRRAQGFEIDLGGEIVRGWSVSLNVGKQWAVASNVLPTWAPYITGVVDAMTKGGFWDMYTNNWNNLLDPAAALPAPTAKGMQSNFYGSVLNNVLNGRAAEGTASPELRRWRANLMTNYTFAKTSRFSGFAVGAGVRWQDKVAIGYPQVRDPADNLFKPVIASPFWGPTELNGDAWTSYRFRWRDKFDCKIQLNVRNVVGKQDAIPVRMRPDGVVDFVRNPQPREFLLTTSFSF